MATSRKPTASRAKAAAPKRKPAAKKAAVRTRKPAEIVADQFERARDYANAAGDKVNLKAEARALLLALENAAAKYGSEAHAEFQSIAARLRALL